VSQKPNQTPPSPPLPLPLKIRYGFETAAAYLLYGIFKIMPAAAASAVGGFLGRSIGPYLGISKKALENLTLAFPEKSEAEKREILRKMWDNLGRNLAEYPHLAAIGKRAELKGQDIVRDIMESGRPAIIFSGHIANWEIGLSSARQQLGFSSHVAYRKPNNPWVDGLLSRARRAGAVGQVTKSRRGALEMTRLIKDKKVLTVLIDQKYNEGLAVPFFGYEAMTMPFPARLALKYDCPLYPGRIERIAGAQIKVTLYPAIEIEKTGDAEKDTLALMSEMHRHLEDWIRERPDQWLWLHRRWPDNASENLKK